MEQVNFEQIIKLMWLKQVHVDEGGYFSDCPDYCDDCFWFDYFDIHATPRFNEFRHLCISFAVSSQYKSYTYYAPTQEA